MFELPTLEEKFFLLPEDVVGKMRRMLKFIEKRWPDAVLLNNYSNEAKPLCEVEVEPLLNEKAYFFIVENEGALPNLEDPTPENWHHFSIGCHPRADIVLEVHVRNEHDLTDNRVKACPFDATVCLSRCWLVIVALPRNENIAGWDEWSLEAARQLRL